MFAITTAQTAAGLAFWVTVIMTALRILGFLTGATVIAAGVRDLFHGQKENGRALIIAGIIIAVVVPLNELPYKPFPPAIDPRAYRTFP